MFILWLQGCIRGQIHSASLGELNGHLSELGMELVSEFLAACASWQMERTQDLGLLFLT